MKKVVVWISALLLGLCLSGCENPSEEGVEYLKNGQYEEAIEQFEKAVEEEVNVGDAYRGIGIARWEQENYEGARESFLKAVEAGAESTGTLYNFIGCCEMKLNNPASAQNYFRLGIAQEGSSAELIQEMKYNMIVAYEQLKNWESAKVELRNYVASYPEDETAKKELQFLETR